MTPEVNYDEYQEVINGPKTFAAIADHLKHAGSAIIGWNDGGPNVTTEKLAELVNGIRGKL